MIYKLSFVTLVPNSQIDVERRRLATDLAVICFLKLLSFAGFFTFFGYKMFNCSVCLFYLFLFATIFVLIYCRKFTLQGTIF